jgi:hypothetical protein
MGMTHRPPSMPSIAQDPLQKPACGRCTQNEQRGGAERPEPSASIRACSHHNQCSFRFLPCRTARNHSSISHAVPTCTHIGSLLRCGFRSTVDHYFFENPGATATFRRPMSRNKRYRLVPFRCRGVTQHTLREGQRLDCFAWRVLKRLRHMGGPGSRSGCSCVNSNVVNNHVFDEPPNSSSRVLLSIIDMKELYH